jgi:CRISPR-associated exonuclease Cas4
MERVGTGEKRGAVKMEPLVEAHALNAYAYCPRRCYYEYVERVFYHNVYTIHGKLLHEHVDQYGQERRGERQVIRAVFFTSHSLGLVAKCDMVEEANGAVYPVEYKRGKWAVWENNELQLCAQALLMEEWLEKEISYGYLYFYGSNRRMKVEFTQQLREKTLQAIESIRQLYQQPVPPAGINERRRCRHCSMIDYCLPQERQQLRGNVQWEHFI